MEQQSTILANSPMAHKHITIPNIIKLENRKKVQNSSISIRQAEMSDVEAIWELLHSEGPQWNTERITTNISSLYVFIDRNKIIGIAYARIKSSELMLNWVAVHPMYPESSVSTALYYTLLGVIMRQPG